MHTVVLIECYTAIGGIIEKSGQQYENQLNCIIRLILIPNRFFIFIIYQIWLSRKKMDLIIWNDF